jgi:transcriptional regulator with XRE-family HTH domain
MSVAQLSVVHADVAPVRPLKGPGLPGAPLHRIQEVRRLQGMSLRTAARQLGTDVRSIRAQEQASSDLRLSDLYKWQAALEVPVDELLVDSAEPLSRPVKERAQMVRVMKTARALVENACSPATERMAQNLIEQLTELMPELKDVSPWHSVGQRRGLDEMGRIAERTLCDDFGGSDLAD